MKRQYLILAATLGISACGGSSSTPEIMITQSEDLSGVQDTLSDESGNGPDPAGGNTTADVSEVCAYTGDDPDGDGIGQIPFSENLCLVTSESAPAPVYINSSTGQPAQLERAFWDGNADLINRDIVCRLFDSDGVTAAFGDFRNNGENWYRFLAIPSDKSVGMYYSAGTQAGLLPNTDAVPFTRFWSEDFGRLQSTTGGESLLGHFPGANSNPYFVNLDGVLVENRVNEFSYIEPFINDDGVEGVRFYESSGILTSDSFFVECSDSSGMPFGPSGSPDRSATTAPSPYIETALPFPGTQEPEPSVVNRETGLQVQFETGAWDAQTDLFFTTLKCTLNVFDDDSNTYTSRFNGGGVSEYTYLPRINGFSPNGSGMILLFEGRTFVNQRWSVSGNDFNDSLFASSQWYEPVTNSANSQGVRYWGNPGDSEADRSGQFVDCYAFDGAGGFKDSFRPR